MPFGRYSPDCSPLLYSFNPCEGKVRWVRAKTIRRVIRVDHCGGVQSTHLPPVSFFWTFTPRSLSSGRAALASAIFARTADQSSDSKNTFGSFWSPPVSTIRYIAHTPNVPL